MDIRDLTYNYYIKRRTMGRPPGDWEGQKVVELGAGIVNYSPYFLKENYTAVDLDPDVAKHVHCFVQADIKDLPFNENEFDKFITIGLLEHTKSPQKVLNRLASICRNGGIVYVPVLDSFPFVYDPINWIRKKLGKSIINFGIGGFGHISMYYKDEWIKMFDQAGYTVKQSIPRRIDVFQALEFFFYSIFISRCEYVLLMNKVRVSRGTKKSVINSNILKLVQRIIYFIYGLLYSLRCKLKGPISYTFILEKYERSL